MRHNWETYKLGEFLDRERDGITLDDTTKYKRLTISGKGQGISLRDTVIGFEIGTKKQYLVKENQFLLSKIDARNGAFGIVPKDCDGGIITGNFWTYNVNNELIEQSYLELLCFNEVFTEFSIEASEGTTNRKYLREDKFLNLSIPLPPLSEQKRIVAKIESIKSKIEAIRGLRAEQEKEIGNLRYSIFKNLFLEFGSTPIKQLIFEDIDAVAVNPIEEYQFAGLYSFGNGLFVRGLQSGNDTTYKTFTRLHSGQLVLSQVKGWEGAISVVPNEFDGYFLSPVYKTFSTFENSNIDFISFFCKMPTTWQKMLDVSKGIGARRNSIYAKDFLELEVPNCPLKKQNEVVLLLGKYEVIRQNYQKQEIELTALLSSTLDKAFKGEL